LPSIRAIAAAVAALLLAPAARGADVPQARAGRFSVSDIAPGPPPGLTLLDPAWLLPPIESLALDLALVEQESPPAPLVGSDSVLAAPGPPRTTGGPLSYPLSDHLSAQFRYRRAQSFDRSGSRSLRDDPSTAFSTLPNRDVFDLNMSWRLAGSTLGLGYQLQSSAGGVWSGAPATAAGFSRFLPGNQQATHSLMFGLTREWGAAEPPPFVEPPLMLPDLEPAGAEATPTP
jgi:hypothetical protein